MSETPTVADLGEHALVARITSRVATPPAWVRLGIGDDAAVVEPAPRQLEVLTTDALVEGVHFTRALSEAADVGHKALAVNLSDLAAMGATPRVALLSLALPPSLPLEWFDGIIEGLLDLACRHDVALVGGNVTRSPGPLVVDVTLTGSVHPRKLLRRAGARPGDALYVSGRIGAAVAGLAWLQQTGAETQAAAGAATDVVAEAVRAYRRPVPRVRLGQLVARNRAASAAIDLSDGLADGVRRVAEAAGLGAIVEAGAVPCHAAADLVFGGRTDAVRAAVAGGDDYELLFAVPRRTERAFDRTTRLVADVPVTRIGELVAAPGLTLRRDGRDEPWPAGFVHFA